MQSEYRRGQSLSDALGEEPPLAARYETTAPVIGSEPRARGTIFVGFKEAVATLWGQSGMERVAAALPRDAAAATLGTVVSAEWLPEAYVIAWYEALWNGPCEQRRDRFCVALDRMMDFGFGRVRRVLLSLAAPATIIERAPALWRYDHTHGQLAIEAGETMARVHLRDHPYTENPLSCMAVAEIYRYCVALTRVRNVTASHYRDGGALVVRVRWEP